VSSRENYARAIIAEGERRGISERGIKIALATALVESNLVMYANNGDPDSLNFPHDALSYDANSVGLFQQRAPWWGKSAADRMDPERSAGLFYAQLAKFSYDSDAHPPGWYAQQIQRSAYPDRYDQRFQEASDLFDSLTGGDAVGVAAVSPSAPKFQERDFMTGGGRQTRSRQPTNFLIHTEEGNSAAEGLAVYCNGANGVSYHYTLRDGVLCDVVDTDYASWSVLSANAFTINLCFAGSFAGWTRDTWLHRESDIEIAAYVAVQDCRKYGIPIAVNPPPYWTGPGIADHKYVTQILGIGTHHDVGDNFPWDVFAEYVKKWADGDVDTTPTPARASVVPPNLVLGSTGQAVERLQDRLKRAYAAYAGHLEVDGDFGPLTEGAVREFQRRSNLAVTGIVDSATAAALRI